MREEKEGGGIRRLALGGFLWRDLEENQRAREKKSRTEGTVHRVFG